MRKTIAIFALAALGATSQATAAQTAPCTNCEAQMLRRLDHIATDLAALKALAENTARYPGRAIDIRDISISVPRRANRQAVADTYCNRIGFGAAFIAASERPGGSLELLTRIICHNPAAPPA